MHEGRDLDELSHCLARFYPGEDRLFSAICWERRWRSPVWFALRLVVDHVFHQRTGELGHCREAWRRERAERAQAGELPERLRVAGL